MTERYQDELTCIRRLSDMACIPLDSGNRFYAQYLVDKDNGAEVLPYVEPAAPVPTSISDRQFFQQLAIDGLITEAEALSSNAAVIPTPLLAIIDTMPAEQQFNAKMVVAGATSFERNHPMTLFIGQASGMSRAEIDAFFIAAAGL